METSNGQTTEASKETPVMINIKQAAKLVKRTDKAMYQLLAKRGAKGVKIDGVSYFDRDYILDVSNGARRQKPRKVKAKKKPVAVAKPVAAKPSARKIVLILECAVAGILTWDEAAQKLVALGK